MSRRASLQGASSLRYLLDSVILIDHFNGVPAATEFLRQHRDECAISAITRAEVLTGFSAEALAAPRALLDVFACLPVDAAVTDAAASLRREHRWKLPDAIQAVLAMQHRLTLVTRNTKNFPARLGFVLAPYALPA